MNLDALVEAKLISITFSGHNQAELAILDVTGKEWLILAEQVDDLFIDEMRMQNLIDEIIFIESSTLLSDAMKKSIYCLMRGEASINIDFEWEPFKDKIKIIESGALSVLEIVPLYGAYILLLAKKINILKIDQTKGVETFSDGR
ncbi:MAG TPA: hypothetical protein VNZ27_09105 [Rhodanobacter sp.]|jgi:hypothetical protein|nr:hypothetical protein [Rhodanobacter sp.]